MGIAVRDFYFPTPKLGVPYANSVEDIRSNSVSLAALVKGAYQDLDTTVDGSHKLSGLAFGQLSNHLKFRVFYDQDNDNFNIQYNTGTVNSPTWVNYVSIRESDGRFSVVSSGGLESTGGFYNLNTTGGFYLVARGSTRDKFVFDRGEAGLVFDSNFFYLENVSNSEEVLVTLTPTGSSGEVNTASNVGTGEGVFVSKSASDLQFKSLTASSPVSVSSSSTEINFTSSAEANTASSLGGDADVFKSKSGVDLQFRGITAGQNVSVSEGSLAITISAHPAEFYGINVGQTDDNPTYRDIDTIKFDNSHFYLTQGTSSANEAQVHIRNIPDHITQIQRFDNLIAGDPGDESDIVRLAGVNTTATLKASEIGPPVTRANLHLHRHSSSQPATLIGSRNADDDNVHEPVSNADILFSIISAGRGDTTYEAATRIDSVVDAFDGSTPGDNNMPGRIDFRTQPPGSGSTTGTLAMSIRADQSVRMENTLNVENSITAEAFYLTSGGELASLSDVGPGFYGVLFRESESGGFSSREDTIVFDSDFFYLSSSSDTKPLLSVQPEITLAELNMERFINFTEIADPTTPAADRANVYIGDEAGVTRLHFQDSTGRVFHVLQDSVIVARNSTGSTITADSVVYISGATGKRPQISLAKADASSTMPAIGIVLEDITNNSWGRVQRTGVVTNIDTSAFSEGDTVYVSPTTAGALTTTEPSHPNLHQEIGTVVDPNVAGTLLLTPKHADGDDFGTQNSTYTIGTSTANSVVLANSSTSQRTATFPDKSGTVAYTSDINAGFYGINVGQSDDSPLYSGINTIKFNSNDFYITQNSPNTDEAIINFRGIPFSVRESDGLPLFTNINLLSFNSDEFYISQGSDPNEAVANLVKNTREVVNSTKKLWVRTDGSDSNDGSANTPGKAFATIQKAVNTFASLDLDIYPGVIMLGNAGTYTGASIMSPWIGGPGHSVTLSGDVGDPDSYVISSTITVSGGGSNLSIQGVDLTTSAGSYSLLTTDGATTTISGNMVFGTNALSQNHCAVFNNSLLKINANYRIDGNAPRHYDIDAGSIVTVGPGTTRTITIENTPTFTIFIFVSECSNGFFVGATFANASTATGTKWNANLNGTIHTGGVGADNMFPGDTGGSSSTGGQTA